MNDLSESLGLDHKTKLSNLMRLMNIIRQLDIVEEDVHKIEDYVNRPIERIKKLIPKNEPKRKAIIMRLFEGATLEESGKIYGVTRERIRQIEKKVFTELEKDNLGEIVTQKILDILFIKRPFNRLTPLSLSRLEFEEPWFEGISKTIISNKSGKIFIERLTKKKVKCEIIGDDLIIREKNQKSFIELLKIIKDQTPISGSIEYKKNIKSMADHEERPYLSDLLISNYEKSLSVRQICVRFSEAIVKENEDGLTLGEIEQEIKKLFPKLADLEGDLLIKTLGNCMSEIPSLFSLESRKWGHEENFRKLDDHEVREMSNLAITIMKNEPEKQWRRSSIKVALNKISKMYKNLTEYDVDWALRKSNPHQEELVNVGRGVWEIKGEVKSKRRELASLALEILKDFGSPMYIYEIIEQIERYRDVKKGQQIHASGNLIHFKSEMFGLRDRDIELTKNEEKDLFDLIELRLELYPEFYFTNDNARYHITQAVVDFEANNTYEKENMALKNSNKIDEIINKIRDICCNNEFSGMPIELFNRSFSSNQEWVNKQIRAKRKWSSVINNNKSEIIIQQNQLRIIEDIHGKEYHKIKDTADKRLMQIKQLDFRYRTEWHETLIKGTDQYPPLKMKKITPYQLLRLLRLDSRFKVILRNESLPKLTLLN